MIRTEFTLTIDDYSDWQGIRQKASSRAPAIASLCGFLLFVIGYVELHWFPRLGAGLGLGCLFAGLLTTGLSVPLWFFVNRKPREVEKEALKEFKKFNSEHRVFEASDSGWRYIVGTQENSRQWKDLFGFLRMGQILVLMDTYVTYPLPVSAFTADQLTALDQLLKEGLISDQIFAVGMVATVGDFIAALAKHNWSRRIGRMIFSYCCGLFCLAFIGLILVNSSPEETLNPWFFAAFLVLPLGELAHYHSLYSKYWKRSFQDADILKHAICFNQGTLHSISERRNIRYEWFESVVETRRVLMLYFKKNNFYIIPKVGLGSERLAMLRQLLNVVPKA
jgi:YcxB-like protein